MKCAEAEMKMYIYTELDTAERALVDAHLKNCVVCRQLMTEIDASQQ
ncbi:MAG: hypothetical protein HC859_06385, partial [Bacteroidia bacterium]|nr:hypothetical protein [Bacteroidia bacterium]